VNACKHKSNVAKTVQKAHCEESCVIDTPTGKEA